MTYSLSYALSFCFYTIPEVHTIQCILPLSGHGSTMHTLVVYLFAVLGYPIFENFPILFRRMSVLLCLPTSFDIFSLLIRR